MLHLRPDCAYLQSVHSRIAFLKTRSPQSRGNCSSMARPFPVLRSRLGQMQALHRWRGARSSRSANHSKAFPLPLPRNCRWSQVPHASSAEAMRRILVDRRNHPDAPPNATRGHTAAQIDRRSLYSSLTRERRMTSFSPSLS